MSNVENDLTEKYLDRMMFLTDELVMFLSKNNVSYEETLNLFAAFSYLMKKAENEKNNNQTIN